MCPLCYIPWIVTLLSIFGLSSVHLWVDANPVLAFIAFVMFLLGFYHGVRLLWNYYKNRNKSCSIKKDK